MSRTEFDDECKSCLPVLIDPSTGRLLPDNHPSMVAVKRAWSLSTLEQREAFHRITCLNSRDPKDSALVHPLIQSMQRMTVV